MDKELPCNFYFGDEIKGSFIKKLKYTSLSGFKKEVKNISIFGLYYFQLGVLQLPFRKYQKYILTGDPYCVSTWIVLIINKILNNDTYLWSHGWYGDEGFIKKKIKYLFFNLSRKTFVYGHRARNLMIEVGFHPEKVVCIYNSISYTSQCAIRSKLTQSNLFVNHFKNNNPNLCYIGRIQKSKKIELLIKAISKLNENGVFVNLVLIGREIENANMKLLAKEYNLEKQIWFYGESYSETKLADLIYNSDVCVVPGNIGLTIIHSFVYGTPVITHDNFIKHGPEFEVLTSGVNGDFYLENSLEDLCNKIKNWISLPVRTRKNVREACFLAIKNKYTESKQVEILINSLK